MQAPFTTLFAVTMEPFAARIETGQEMTEPAAETGSGI
jgi:hypothetical protein